MENEKITELPQKSVYDRLISKNYMSSQTLWLIPVIPALRRLTETGQSRVGGQLELHNKKTEKAKLV